MGVSGKFDLGKPALAHLRLSTLLSAHLPLRMLLATLPAADKKINNYLKA